MKNVTTKTGIVLIGLGMFFTACQNMTFLIPSRNVITIDRSIGSYEGIEISTAFTVDISFSDTEELIEIEADDNLHQYIEVERVNNVLRIRIEDNAARLIQVARKIIQCIDRDDSSHRIRTRRSRTARDRETGLVCTKFLCNAHNDVFADVCLARHDRWRIRLECV